MLSSSRGAQLTADVARVPVGEDRRVRRRRAKALLAVEDSDDAEVIKLALRYYAKRRRDALTLREFARMVAEHVSGVPALRELEGLAERARSAAVAAARSFFGDDGLCRPDLAWWASAEPPSAFLVESVLRWTAEEAARHELLRGHVVFVRFVGAGAESVEEKPFVRRSDKALDDVFYGLTRVCEFFRALPGACRPARLARATRGALGEAAAMLAAADAQLDTCFQTLDDAQAMDDTLMMQGGDYFGGGATLARRVDTFGSFTSKLAQTVDVLAESWPARDGKDRRTRLALLWSQRCRLHEALQALEPHVGAVDDAVFDQRRLRDTTDGGSLPIPTTKTLPRAPTYTDDLLPYGGLSHVALLELHRRFRAAGGVLKRLDKTLLILVRDDRKIAKNAGRHPSTVVRMESRDDMATLDLVRRIKAAERAGDVGRGRKKPPHRPAEGPLLIEEGPAHSERRDLPEALAAVRLRDLEAAVAAQATTALEAERRAALRAAEAATSEEEDEVQKRSLAERGAVLREDEAQKDDAWTAWAREAGAPLSTFALRHLRRKKRGALDEDDVAAAMCASTTAFAHRRLEAFARTEGGTTVARAVAADALFRVVNAVEARLSSPNAYCRRGLEFERSNNGLFLGEEAVAPTPNAWSRIVHNETFNVTKRGGASPPEALAVAFPRGGGGGGYAPSPAPAPWDEDKDDADTVELPAGGMGVLAPAPAPWADGAERGDPIELPAGEMDFFSPAPAPWEDDDDALGDTVELPAGEMILFASPAPAPAPAPATTEAPAPAPQSRVVSIAPAPTLAIDAPMTVDDDASFIDTWSSVAVRVGRGMAALGGKDVAGCVEKARAAALEVPWPLDAALYAVYVVHGGDGDLGAADVVATARRLAGGVVSKEQDEAARRLGMMMMGGGSSPKKGPPSHSPTTQKKKKQSRGEKSSSRLARSQRRAAAVAAERLASRGRGVTLSTLEENSAVAQAALDSRGRTALHAAAQVGDVDAIAVLLARGADASRRDFCGEVAANVAPSTRVSRRLRGLRTGKPARALGLRSHHQKNVVPPHDSGGAATTVARGPQDYPTRAALRRVDWTVTLLTRRTNISAWKPREVRCTLYDLRHRRLFFSATATATTVTRASSCAEDEEKEEDDDDDDDILANDTVDAVLRFDACRDAATSDDLFDFLKNRREADLSEAVLATLLGELTVEAVDLWTSTARERLARQAPSPAPAPSAGATVVVVVEAPAPATFTEEVLRHFATAPAAHTVEAPAPSAPAASPDEVDHAGSALLPALAPEEVGDEVGNGPVDQQASPVEEALPGGQEPADEDLAHDHRHRAHDLGGATVGSAQSAVSFNSEASDDSDNSGCDEIGVQNANSCK